MKAPIPILRSFSEDEARAFYIDWLGFSVLFEHRFASDLPLYLALRQGDCELHISEHHGDATPGSAVRIEVTDIDALLSDLTGRGHPRLRPGIEEMPWGFREMRLTDPFGNRLVFCEPVADG